ncbi:hypothetical protein H4R33_001934 [Dimargaris cristalligena]|nr:hypothetical protein H4R33_001934 [Dimargaris cristalligena]
MIDFACVGPQERFKRITKQVSDLLCFNSNPYLKAFGIKMSDQLLSINGRQLPPPTVVYGGHSRNRKVEPKDGSWNMRGKRFFEGARIKSYGVLVLDRDNDQSRRIVSKFMEQLNQTLFDMGVDLIDIPFSDTSNPDMDIDLMQQQLPITFVHILGGLSANLSKARMEARGKFREEPQIIYVLFNPTARSVYGEIKRIPETEMGIVTQCMMLSKICQPNNSQYMNNVALKVNVKLGGINGQLKLDQSLFLSNGSTMVIGADVSHPGPDNRTDPSIAAVVGSIDKSITRFASEDRVLPLYQKIIPYLYEPVSKLLEALKEKNQCPPGRILYYRTGLPETHYHDMLNKELTEIQKAVNGVCKNKMVNITIIVCQKRHHMRFSPLNRSRGDRSGNCPAGTVVDRDVTHPTEFDFFLQSHRGLRGTSRLTRYIVLHDDNGFTTDDLQQLTNQLCYLYPLATRARFHRRSQSDLDDSASQDTPTYGHLDVIQLASVRSDVQKGLYFM